MVLSCSISHVEDYLINVNLFRCPLTERKSRIRAPYVPLPLAPRWVYGLLVRPRVKSRASSKCSNVVAYIVYALVYTKLIHRHATSTQWNGHINCITGLKIPNRGRGERADQLAIYKHDLGVELWSIVTGNNSNWDLKCTLRIP